MYMYYIYIYVLYIFMYYIYILYICNIYIYIKYYVYVLYIYISIMYMYSIYIYIYLLCMYIYIYMSVCDVYIYNKNGRKWWFAPSKLWRTEGSLSLISDELPGALWAGTPVTRQVCFTSNMTIGCVWNWIYPCTLWRFHGENLLINHPKTRTWKDVLNIQHENWKH